MAESREGLWMTGKDRERLKVLHECQASPRIDGVTWQEYETGLEDRLTDLAQPGASWNVAARQSSEYRLVLRVVPIRSTMHPAVLDR